MTTQTCAMPGCRILGRHLPACDGDCRGCLPRTATDGWTCDPCTGRAARHLAEIITLAPDALAVAYGQVRRAAGASGGKPGSRSPGNDDALDTVHTTHDHLARICIHIATTRGVTFRVPCLPSCVKPTPSQAHCSVCHETFGSVSGFDRHRRGGQCLNPTTIPGIHRNPAGVWRFGGGQNRAAAHRGTPQTDENGSGVPESTLEPQEAL